MGTGITEEELKALPRTVGHMKDEIQLYQLLADCRWQILMHGDQVASGEPCPECRWSLVRDVLPCAELEALERAAREAWRATQGGIPLGALAADWRVEDHRRACVTCQTVRPRLVIEDGPTWSRVCPALKRLYSAKRIYKRRIWHLILKAEPGTDMRGAEVEKADG